MFEHLTRWSRILVTGPQRSGTRICAKMIAADTGFDYVDESSFYVDSLNHLWRVIRDRHRIVIQAPALSGYANLLGMADRNMAVVMMRRDLKDIAASERRIKWEWGFPELLRLHAIKGNPAEMKYGNWDFYQKQDLEDQAYEVAYDALAEHPLWVPKEDRKHFTYKQTEV